MGQVLSQRLPGLLARSSCSGSAAAQLPGRLLHRVPSGKKEQLVLSKAAIKSPQSLRVVLQNSNELSTLATPTAPLSLQRCRSQGWLNGQGRGKRRHHW